MSVFKIIGGTSRGDEHLCTKCRHYTRVRHDNNVLIQTCEVNYQNVFTIRNRVVECNRFDPKDLPSLRDMDRIAWILRTSNSGQAVGFMTPREYREKHGDPNTNNDY